jgi:hypothetical protein
MSVAASFQGIHSKMLLSSHVDAFIKNFGTHTCPKAPFPSMAGRVLRGKVVADFISLTDNPDRKIVFLVDEHALLA